MKIAINLLPIDYIQEEVKKTKFYKIQAIGIAVILLMVFLASLVVALRVLQSQNIKVAQTQVSAQEQKISDLKDKQVSLFILKDRLSVIDKYLNTSSKQVSLYQLLDKLIPPSVVVSSVAVDKAGQIVLSCLVPDSQTLDEVVSNMTDTKINQNKISQVSLDNISRGRDGVYRVGFTIKTL